MEYKMFLDTSLLGPCRSSSEMHPRETPVAYYIPIRPGGYSASVSTPEPSTFSGMYCGLLGTALRLCQSQQSS